ncbi:phage major capsid protein [Propionimicrobium sp. PCR01-08-3]|uniref:phage major capsid protein n=1 Tax=Propionimicrobium sp. PCR01-08-3 TaxID=3052086 RepID=UPI00255C2D04|nr:phage major capsid protein [Propionimicrobium sp. PCR01-08-3]WIY81771.1 phage major capsid protein [Propionimicrobium sp. PCR01-08-3]
MSVDTTTATELTYEQIQKILIAPLQEQSVFLAAGPRIFDTAGPIRIPKNQPATAEGLGFTGENEQIGERDIEFDEVTLMPSTMKSVKTLTRYSNELARQSAIGLDAAIKDRLVNDVAAKLDAQFLSAAGDGVTTPKGLFAYTGTQTLAVGGALSLDALLTAWGLALAANVNMAGLKWLLTPGDFVALRKVKDKNDQYLLQADPTADGVFRLWGCPVVVSSRIPDDAETGRAALVDFSQIAVARDMAPSVKILTERFADYDQQAIRVVARYDAAPLNPEAIVTLTGITR